jgi:hypothetical protein
MREVSHALLETPWLSLPSTSKSQKMLGVVRLHDDQAESTPKSPMRSWLKGHEVG